MEYNLLDGALWSVNTTEGNKNLSFSDLRDLSSYSGSPVTELSTSDKLVLDFDLGLRLHVDKFKYQFNSSVNQESVASGIKFYYKNENFESFIPLLTYVESPDIFYTTKVESEFSPRYLRLEHDLSETNGVTIISGSAYGIMVSNDDSFVDFGDDGTKVSENFDVVKGVTTDVRAIPILNSSSFNVDAFINLEPVFTDLDQAVAISLSSEGPWVFPLDESFVIHNSGNFNYGTFYLGTQDTYGPLMLDGFNDVDGNFVSKYSYGEFISKVFLRSTSNYSRIICDLVDGYDGSINVDNSDVTDTIYIRSHNAPPSFYGVIRELKILYPGSGDFYVVYLDRWLRNKTIKDNDSDYLFSDEDFSVYYSDGITYCFIRCDETTGNIFGAFILKYGSQDEVHLFNSLYDEGTNNRFELIEHTSETINFTLFDIKHDYSSGFWIHFFAISQSSSDFVDTTGYYLVYFDKNLNEKYTWYNSVIKVGSFDVDKTTKHVWFTRPTEYGIYKMNTEGEIKFSCLDEDYTSYIGVVVVDSEGSLIFVNGSDLHKLNSDGTLISSFSMTNVFSETVGYMALDIYDNNAIWLIEGNYVKYFYMYGNNKGSFGFSVAVADSRMLFPVYDGVWVKCSDADGIVTMRFISRINKREEFDSFSPSGNSSVPGLIYETYTNKNYTDRMPVDTDIYWPALPWNKVGLDNYLLSENRYHQLKVVLRRQRLSDRYSFVSDTSLNYTNEDDFNQTSTTPKQYIWGDLSTNDRVYVTGNELYLKPVIGSGDAFISTKDRVLFSYNDDNEFEVRVDYRLGNGNVYPSGTGKDEYIYLNAYCVDQDISDRILQARLYIPPDPTSEDLYVSVSRYGTGWTHSSSTDNVSLYEGSIRLYLSSGSIYCQVKSPSGDWWGPSVSFNSASHGQHFYVYIAGSDSGSDLFITSFSIVNGDTYYYTESPRVRGIYQQELLKINNLPPLTSEDIYLKTFVNNSLNVNDLCDIDMKVRFEVPTQ